MMKKYSIIIAALIISASPAWAGPPAGPPGKPLPPGCLNGQTPIYNTATLTWECSDAVVPGGSDGQVQYSCAGEFCGASMTVDGEGNMTGIYIPRSITDLTTVPENGELALVGNEPIKGDGSTASLALGANLGPNVTRSVTISAESQTWTSGAYLGGNKYVAVASDGTSRVLLYNNSTKAISLVAAAAANSWKSVVATLYSGSYRAVAVSSDGTNRAMYSNATGATWTSSTTSPDAESTWEGVCTDGAGKMYAVASSGTNRFAKSTDGGINWTSMDISGSFDSDWKACAYIGGNVIITDYSSYTTGQMIVYTSDEGTSWTRSNVLKRDGSEGAGISALACSTIKCLAYSGQPSEYSGYNLLVSSDGINWGNIEYAPPFVDSLTVTGESRFVFYNGEAGRLISAFSANGETWEEVYRNDVSAIKIGAVLDHLYLPYGGTVAELLLDSKVRNAPGKNNLSGSINGSLTTVSGATGTCECNMPIAGLSYKKVACYCDALDGAETYDYLFPFPFKHAPFESGDLTAAAAPTTAKITFSPASTPRTGWYFVEGF